jgi:hypothetical protein
MREVLLLFLLRSFVREEELVSGCFPRLLEVLGLFQQEMIPGYEERSPVLSVRVLGV